MYKRARELAIDAGIYILDLHGAKSAIADRIQERVRAIEETAR